MNTSTKNSGSTMLDYSGDVVPYPPHFARQYREAGYWQTDTLQDFASNGRDRFGNRIAVRGTDHTGAELALTYDELAARVDQLAAGLAQHGVRRGDSVLVQLPNWIEFVEAVLALFRLGAVPVFALPAHRREILHVAAASQAVAYIIPASHGGFDYRALARELSGVLVFVVGDPGEFIAFDALRGGNGRFERVAATDVALLQLSGGTTGAPKLIPRTHADYLYSVRASAEICGLDSSTVMLLVLPAAHNFPLSSPGWLGALHAGGQIVLVADQFPDSAFALIERFRVTITALVPALALKWLSACSQTPHDLSSLEVLQVGGAKFDAASARRVRPELGAILQQVFGMSEGLVCYTRLDDPETVITTTQGRPISPDDEIRVVDDDDLPVEPGTDGHLQTRGPYTIRGYYRATVHNQTAFTGDGFYRTGDIVRLTPDGNLVVTGRAKDQINRCGEKFAPAEVENLLLSHPGVRNAAVISVPDAQLGERSCAFIVISDNAERAPAAWEVRRFVRESGLAAFKVPDQIEFVSRLPTTAVGKIDKKALLNQLAPQATKTIA